MDSYIIDETRKLHVCGNNPECSGFWLSPEYSKSRVTMASDRVRDKCGSDMQLKTGRFGKYFGCTAEECKNTPRNCSVTERQLLRKLTFVPMPELPCEQSDGYFILRDGAAGMFLASSLFPRSRETKKPKVEDLVRHKDELDEKHLFLANGPVKDPDGNHYLSQICKKNKRILFNL